jgi:hypothetical protein
MINHANDTQMLSKPFLVVAKRFSFALILELIFLTGCVEDPIRESAPELITKAVLTFTPDFGSPIVVSATDPDGEGVQDISADGTITLEQNKSYNLTIALFNELADPTSPEFNITNEVEEAGDEHIFFFAWTNNLFSTPQGNGNIDNRNDAIGYDDEDLTGLPIGLSTQWTAGSQMGSGTFRVLLKHQPGQKSAISGATDGETDLELTFDLEVR